ncbi:hypothetical protein ES319_A05G409300v1 [Gossypium barbadense]|uniref:Sieve element occlusion N-terminal domain-containing protein n=2 Tax=Gossypium TaxID=3633 RepID=A0A5J5VZT4_GOSBA|nr:hypothetical protein ES319_A05G409300v1 [Gossypium barbadense]TYH20525.1 hypothetical protein ES288_A05G437000v1 [Gossypium darwinii]
MAAEAKTSHPSRYYSFDKLSQQTQMTNKTNSLQTLEPDVRRHLLDLVESIFKFVVDSKDTDQSAELDNMISSLERIQGMRQVLNDIRDISCEMSCNLLAAGSGNLEKTRTAVLERLRSYSWSAKVVIAIAAFASSIGELSMLVKHRDDDLMAKLLVKILKGHSPKLDLNALAEAGLTDGMLEVVRTNLKFSDSLKVQESMKEAMLEFYLNATKNIFDIVLQISAVLSKREDVHVELKSFSAQLRDISIQLQDNMKYIGAEKISPLEYEEVSEISTSELIAKIKKCIEVQDSEKLRNKHVLFLISDLNISIEEIKVLERLYEENEGKYEIVWLPIVGSLAYDDKAEARFLELRQMMKWIAVFPPRIKEVIQYIKRDWHFIKEAIAVSVTEGGEITCLNALPMLWTWGKRAFPFTDEEWKKLDERKTWTLDSLFDQLILPGDSGIDIESWTKSEATLVCLFGGGDISWNQEFIQKVNNAAQSAGVFLKLVYLGVGKNKGKGLTRNQLGRDILVIQSESQWQFWSRLESILYAKIRFGKKDEVMQEALKVVGYGGNGEEWAMFSMGQGAMVTTSGKTALTIMEHYQQMERSGMIGVHFLEGIKKYKKLITRDVHSCINLHLPAMGQIPGIMICPECSKVMDVFYTYRCCPE